VAGGIHDVDANPFPGDGGELGQDGDAALAFEVVGIHRAIGDNFAGAEGACLAQKSVDQRGLSVIDVRDDRDVAHITAAGVESVMILLESAVLLIRAGRHSTKSC
jgi:hypothetical protein